MVADLVNYLDYMAEPARTSGSASASSCCSILGVLFVFAYALKREYWKDVH